MDAAMRGARVASSVVWGGLLGFWTYLRIELGGISRGQGPLLSSFQAGLIVGGIIATCTYLTVGLVAHRLRGLHNEPTPVGAIGGIHWGGFVTIGLALLSSLGYLSQPGGLGHRIEACAYQFALVATIGAPVFIMLGSAVWGSALGRFLGLK